MKKQTTTAFKKKIYLLGADAEGTKYWLEAPSWDCDWYWGFGYVETYTNNNCKYSIQGIPPFIGTFPVPKMGYVKVPVFVLT